MAASPLPELKLERTASPPATMRVVRKHHGLVRLSHWLNVPLLAGLVATGLAIYWASPVFLHAPSRLNGNRDWLGDAGLAIAAALHDQGAAPRLWVYDHFSLGAFQLAPALRLHWLFAYLFMLNGAVYALGLVRGGGWRALLPRPSDFAEAIAMLRFYAGVVPMALLRRPWPHPDIRSKYNALQRAAYFSMPLFGTLIVASGWAMHKPAMLGWFERLFGGYDGARIIHFFSMIVLASFVVPHVILVAADGWDTFRSMIVGWSARTKEHSDD